MSYLCVGYLHLLQGNLASVHVRLWDVPPDGAQAPDDKTLLVSRGTYLLIVPQEDAASGTIRIPLRERKHQVVEIVRSQPGRESGRVQNVSVEAWDFEEQRAGPLLPVERKVAIEFLQTAGSIFDGRRAAGRCTLTASASLTTRTGGCLRVQSRRLT